MNLTAFKDDLTPLSLSLSVSLFLYISLSVYFFQSVSMMGKRSFSWFVIQMDSEFKSFYH
jgi:hypothetical protein